MTRSHHDTLSYPSMPTATPKIELIYDPDCPNVERARERLSQAVAERGQGLGWTEWRSDDPALPDYARGHGSPTILIDERDVAADRPQASSIAFCLSYTHLRYTLTRYKPRGDSELQEPRG